jgi:choice-of-anchor B domain-containing protein
MKKSLLPLLLFFLPLFSNAQYQSQNVSLMGHWYNPTQQAEPTYGIKYQGVCGWKDTVQNREYAILGTSTGTEFIDVTNPATPVVCDYVAAAHGNLIWHEIKTWGKYCYIVSDDNPPNTFIIVDLSYLPDSVHILRNDNTLFERCHTLFVDGHYLYGGSVTKSNNVYYSMAVYDLSVDPVNPPLLRYLNQDYAMPQTVHDMFVRNDTCYCSGGYDGFYIYHFNSTTNNQFTQMAVLTNYPESGYNHASSLTANGSTIIFTDEVPAGKGIKSLDVSNFGNLTINQVFRSHVGNTPHNPYIIGNNILICANYTDGVQIFNIANPSNCTLVGYFDTDTIVNFPTYPANMTYHGCWGAYEQLPSGNLLAADMQNGLYVLDISQVFAGITENSPATISLNAFPNPFSSDFYVNLKLDVAQTVSYDVFDAEGKLVLTEKTNMPAGPSLLEISAGELPEGTYIVKISGETFQGTSRLVKTN